MWFCGATLVIAGVMLMVGSTDSSTEGKPDVKTGDGAVKKSEKRTIRHRKPVRSRTKDNFVEGAIGN